MKIKSIDEIDDKDLMNDEHNHHFRPFFYNNNDKHSHYLNNQSFMSHSNATTNASAITSNKSNTNYDIYNNNNKSHLMTIHMLSSPTSQYIQNQHLNSHNQQPNFIKLSLLSQSMTNSNDKIIKNPIITQLTTSPQPHSA